MGALEADSHDHPSRAAAGLPLLLGLGSPHHGVAQRVEAVIGGLRCPDVVVRGAVERPVTATQCAAITGLR